MPNEPRRQVQDLILSCAEPQYRASQETTPRSITVTTMTTTTFTSASVTSTLVGCYAIPEDGNIRAVPRQVVSVSGTTATVDAAWTSTTGVTVLRTWLPPDVPARSTATGSTTSLTSSPHQNVTNEPDSYWLATTKGYFLLGKTGNNAGGAFKIATFTQATGVFLVTGDSFAASVADGDLFLIRKMIRPEGPAVITTNRKTVSRRIVGFKAADQAIPVTAEGSIELTLPQRPITTSPNGATAGSPPLELTDMLQDFATQQGDGSSNITSNASQAVTVASPANFNVGGFVLLSNGEASQITAISGSVLTTPNNTGQTAVSPVLGSTWYQVKTSDYRTRTFDCYRGGMYRQILHGCMPTLQIQISRDAIVKFVFKYMAAEAFEYDLGAQVNGLSGHRVPLVDTTVPVDAKGSRFYIGTTPVLVGDIKIDLGLKPVMRASLSGANQYDGCTFDLEPVKIDVTGYLADNNDIASFQDLSDQIQQGGVVSLFYQKGSNAKECWCFAAPAAQLVKDTFAYNSGQGEFSCSFECVLPQAARANSAAATLPDFAFGWVG